MSQYRQGGFTLIEVLLSVGILSLIMAMSVPLYQVFQVRNDLDVTTQAVVSSIRRAEVYARASKTDSQWGIHMQADSVTLFQGNAYATRDSSKDETISLSATITSNFAGDVIFNKLTGYPSVYGTVALSTTGSDTRSVTLNANGSVTY